MALDRIYAGDTYGVQVTVAVGGTPVNINASSVVTAGIVEPNTNTLLAGPWTCSNAASGANWSAGVVVVPLDGDDTLEAFSTATTQYTGQFEIEVTYSSETKTYRSGSFLLVKDAV